MKPTVSTPRKIIIDQKPNQPISPKATAHGKQEGHFEVEDDEQDRDQIEADVELHARVVEGVEAALIGRQLFRVRLLEGDDEGRDQQRQADEGRHPDKDHERQIVLLECRSLTSLFSRSLGTATDSSDLELF